MTANNINTLNKTIKLAIIDKPYELFNLRRVLFKMLKIQKESKNP